MSYDVRLLLLQPGEDPWVAAHSDDELDATLSPEAKTRIDRVVDALRTHDPDLEVVQNPADGELSDVSGGTGIQIALFAASGALSIPFWPENSAPEVRSKVAEYLRVLSNSGGYVVFDPQTDQVLSAETGFAVSTVAFSAGETMLKQATKRPWWKFW